MKTSEIRANQDILSTASDLKPGDIYFHADGNSFVNCYPQPSKKGSYIASHVSQDTQLEIVSKDPNDPNWIQINLNIDTPNSANNFWTHLPDLPPKWIKCTRHNSEVGFTRAVDLLFSDQITCRSTDTHTQIRDLILQAQEVEEEYSCSP